MMSTLITGQSLCQYQPAVSDPQVRRIALANAIASRFRSWYTSSMRLLLATLEFVEKA